MIEDKRTAAAASYHVATHGGSCEQGARGARPGCGMGLDSAPWPADFTGGGLPKGSLGPSCLPTGLQHGGGISYKAEASRLGAGRQFPSTGCGRARQLGRSPRAAATYAGPEGSVGGSSGDDCLRP